MVMEQPLQLKFLLVKKMNKTTKPRILFVDDEKNIIDGLTRMLRPYRYEWEMFFVLSGQEALEFMQHTNIDLLITDMRMPQMNGAELLQIVQEKYPQVIRVVLSGHSDENLIIESVKTAHQFLAKPCTAEALIDTILKMLLMRDNIQDDALIKIINGVEELPSAPEMIIKLDGELNSKNISLKNISHIISEDVSLSAKMLQMVNSAYFGLPSKIADLDNAVSILGVNTIKSLILFLKLNNGNYPIPATFSLDELWHHSLSVAKASQLIFEYEMGPSPLGREVYAAGLLHDMGKLVLLKYPGYIENFLLPGSKEIADKEYEKLSISHAEVGAYLLGLWNLPNHISDAVAMHHKPEAISTFGLPAAVCFANLLINDINEQKIAAKAGVFSDKIEKWKTLVQNLL